MNKRCPRCEETKDLNDYYALKSAKNGVQGYCKKCQNQLDKIARDKRKINGPSIFKDAKVCNLCNNKKPISQFGLRRDTADGHLSYCKPCWTTYCKKAKQRAANK